MSERHNLEKCHNFINYHLQPPRAVAEPPAVHWKAVTLSRQAGSGGHTVGDELARLLSGAEFGSKPWTIFDRDLVLKVLEEHNLPKRMEQFMTEDRISGISDTLDELFGLHPPSSTLVRNTTETILHLTELGNVILIGRGANVITAGLPNVFHVRLVASLEKRIESLAEMFKWSPRTAREFALKEDRGRKRYLKKYFGQDIDDPLLYHLVINIDLIGFKESARLIAQAMLGPKTHRS
jgi:cytidylate kinase